MDKKPVEISRKARTEVDARAAAAVRELADINAELRRRAGEPPRPGDLYVAAETADHPVEWLVVDVDPRRPHRLLVVPADIQPLVGSADVAVADHEPGGPLALRCGHGIWLDAAVLRPEMRTGTVARETLARLRDKRWELAKETITASTEQLETDVDPEYMLWVENVLTPARTALEASGRPRLRLVRGAGGDAWRRRRWHPALAAALPLAACLAWLLVWFPDSRHPPEPVTLLLTMSTRTGGEPTLTLRPTAEVVELHVDLEGDDDYDRFRATLTTVAGVEVWIAGDLEKNAVLGGSEVVVRLPAARLEAGDYELALEGLTGGEVSAVGFYGFRIVRP